MALKICVIALSLLAAASPVAAASRESVPPMPAPTEGPDARYCMHLAPFTGSLIETTRCWTRAQWADQGVDVDKEWAKEGVAVLK